MSYWITTTLKMLIGDVEIDLYFIPSFSLLHFAGKLCCNLVEWDLVMNWKNVFHFG